MGDTFPDVDPTNVFYDDIEWAAERDIYDGHADGTFRPKDPVLREQDAKTLRRAVRLIDPELAKRLPEPPPPDTTPPVIVLLGDNPLEMLQGNEYVEPGWETSDDSGGPVEVVVRGAVDVGTPGDYDLEYQATDEAGNFSIAVRVVVVVAFTPPPVGDWDVILEPGSNLQALVDQAGEGGKVGVAPGVYSNAGIRAREGQLIELVDPAQATEWNGNGRSYGLQGNGVQAVVVRGHGKWTLHNYNPGLYKGVVDTFAPGDWYNNPLYLPHGWDVDGLFIADSTYAAITMADHNARFTNCEFMNIGTLGFSMRFGTDQYVGGLKMRHIGWNNRHSAGWGHEGGGSKSWETLRLVHEDIDVADTKGPGLWTDHGNNETVYRRIVARDTSVAAIFHEISGPCLIEDFDIADLPGNGDDSVWSRGGQGINIANAQAEIRNGVLRNMETGIGFIDHNRGGWTGTCGGTVHHVTLDNAGRSGAAGNGTEGRVNWHDNVLKNGSWID